MTPAELSGESFARYPSAGRAFATQHLALLRKLPAAVCPSFLREMQRLDTSFPAEVESLRVRCDFLQGLDGSAFMARTEALRKIHLSRELEVSDWVNNPARFLRDLTSYLWSSGQLDAFHAGSTALLDAIPSPQNDAPRLTMVMAGAGVERPHGDLFRKLRKRGLLLTGLDASTMQRQIAEAFVAHSSKENERYESWYVDGGVPLQLSLPKKTIVLSYAQMEPLRRAALAQMETFLASRGGGAEEMRDRLSGVSPEQVKASRVTADPILQRFYTELFTEGSGPQIFSTTFVQWTGRELARRAQPRTTLLRYVPRQRYRGFNEMIEGQRENEVDAEGSLRDAEMGAYYNLLDMDRISERGRHVFVLWLEGTSNAIIVAPHAPAGTRSDAPTTLQDALRSVG